MSNQYYVPPSLNEALKDIKNRLKALSNTQAIPTYTMATLPPTATGAQLVFVSDASSGSRYQGWDATFGGWVPLG